jgi:hypothetical protein
LEDRFLILDKQLLIADLGHLRFSPIEVNIAEADFDEK